MAYCLKCKKAAQDIDYAYSIQNGVCDSKKSRLMKKQEAKRLLSSLSLKTPLSMIPLLSNILL